MGYFILAVVIIAGLLFVRQSFKIHRKSKDFDNDINNATMEKHDSFNWVITTPLGRQYIGGYSVWYIYPEAVRVSLKTENLLSDVYMREKMKIVIALKGQG